MKNRFEIRGDVTAIFLQRKDGSVIETLIDTVDLPIVQEIASRLHAWWCKDTQSFYCRFRSKKETYLHRHLMRPSKGMVVDHFNHDTLDNRRHNFRVISKAENMQNRKGPTKTNTSGVRGVYWRKDRKKWHAQITVKGKNMFLGIFDDLEEAKIVSLKARAELMPHSQEAANFQ
jgi:hypothetical protein